MKPSYSTKWILCWILLVLALLVLIAGVFAFSIDWRQGLGLTLIGIGTAGPTAWWLRHANRKTRVSHITIIACLGVVLVVGGAILLPWKDFVEERQHQADNTHEKTPKSSVEKSPAPTSANSSTATPSTQTAETESPSPKPTPSEADPEPAVTVTEVETLAPPRATVTEVETLAPPQVTVYSEVPVTPAPPQNNNPDAGGAGIQPEPSDDVPAEPTTQTENTSPAPLESGNPQQDQTTEGQHIPNGGDAGGNRTGAGDIGRGIPEFGGVVPTDPSQLLR